MNRIVLLGPPGCGKGTYAKHIVRVLQDRGKSVEHISTGDMMRAEVAQNSSLGREIDACSRLGALVPDSVVFQLLEPLFNASNSNDRVLLFDGFPRTVAQAATLQARCPVDRVVNISMREDVLVRKSCARRICNDCGVSFNLEHVDEPNETATEELREGSEAVPVRFCMPAVLPTDPACIEKNCIDRLVQRKDDTESVVRRRLEVFRLQTKPILEYYRGLGAFNKHNLLLLSDVIIAGGSDVMAPVFENAAGLNCR